TTMRLESTYAEVDRCRRVPDQHLRRIGGRNPVVGGELGESGQYGRLLPHRFRQRAVDGDVGLDAGDADVELVVAAAVDDGGSGGEDEAGLHGSKMADRKSFV